MIPKGQKVVVTPLLPRIGAVLAIVAGVVFGFQAWQVYHSDLLAQELGYPTGGIPWWVFAISSPAYLVLGVVDWLRRNSPPPGWQYGDDADQS